MKRKLVAQFLTLLLLSNAVTAIGQSSAPGSRSRKPRAGAAAGNGGGGAAPSVKAASPSRAAATSQGSRGVAMGQALSVVLGENRTADYVRVMRESRGPGFDEVLERIVGAGEAEDAEAALDAQIENLSGAMEAKLGEVRRRRRKAIEDEAKDALEAKKKQPAVAAAEIPGVAPRERVFTRASWRPETSPRKIFAAPETLFVKAAYTPAARTPARARAAAPAAADAGEPQLTVTETDGMVTMSGAAEVTNDLKEATVKHSQKLDTKIIFTDKTVGEEWRHYTLVEITAKTKPIKVVKEQTILFRVEVDYCPDVAGVVKGRVTTSAANKNTTTLGKEIGAVMTDVRVDGDLRGQVGDDAELRMFDLDAVASQTIFGYDRAVAHGVFEEVDGKRDGTKKVSIAVKENSFDGKETSGDGKILGYRPPEMTEAEWRDMHATGEKLLGSVWHTIPAQLSMARTKWMNGHCVEVKCATNGKTMLSPGEQVEVVAETVHKHDKSGVPASLKASGEDSVTPGDQKGTPRARFTLTAPLQKARDSYTSNANFSVESVSRRGIASEYLKFDLEPDDKICDGAWRGQITVEYKNSFERKNSIGGGHLASDSTGSESYSAKLTMEGERDRTGGLTNGFVTYAEVKAADKEEHVDRYDEMGFCGKNNIRFKGPKTTRREHAANGTSAGRVTVYIAVGSSHATLDLPEMPHIFGSKATTRTQQSACAENDLANSDKDSGDAFEFQDRSFNVAIPLDPRRPNELKGSLNVPGDSPGETTTYTWNLVRCPPKKRAPATTARTRPGARR